MRENSIHILVSKQDKKGRLNVSLEKFSI